MTEYIENTGHSCVYDGCDIAKVKALVRYVKITLVVPAVRAEHKFFWGGWRPVSSSIAGIQSVVSHKFSLCHRVCCAQVLT